MESKDGWCVISWHFVDIFHDPAMFRSIWNVVVEFSDRLVEAVVLLEDCISQPELAVGIEQFSVKVVSDSSTVLHFTDHVLDGVP